MFANLSGVRIPLVQAPMAGVQGVELALAVAGAGALGSLPCALLGLDALRAALERIRARSATVNINFFCHPPPLPDSQREAAWRAAWGSAATQRRKRRACPARAASANTSTGNNHCNQA